MDQLAGTSLELDPGSHSFRVVAPTGRATERSVVVNKGEKDRRLAFDVDDRPVDPVADDRGTSALDRRTIGYAAAGLALLAGGTAPYFGIRGVSQRAACGMTCSDDERREIYSEKFVAADVAMAVAVIAAG